MTYRSVAKADVAELSAALDSAVSPEKAHHLVIVSTNKVLSTTQFKQLFYSRGDDFFQIANVYECPDSCDSVHSSVWGIDCKDPHNSAANNFAGLYHMGHNRLAGSGGVGNANNYKCYNFNKLGGRENDPEGCAWAYSYVHDQSRNFYAQHEVMGYLEKDTCVKRDFWTACSRMSIEDQLYGLAFASETDQDLCMAVTCARRWSEVEDALAESCTAADTQIVNKPLSWNTTSPTFVPAKGDHQHGMHLATAAQDDDTALLATSAVLVGGGTNTPGLRTLVNKNFSSLADTDQTEANTTKTSAGEWHKCTVKPNHLDGWMGTADLGVGGWYKVTITASNYTAASAGNTSTINGMAPVTLKIGGVEYPFYANADKHEVCFHIADEKTFTLQYYVRTNSVAADVTTGNAPWGTTLGGVKGNAMQLDWIWQGALEPTENARTGKKPGQHVDLYINVRVSNGHPKALDTILRIRFTVKYDLHEPSALHTWNTRASTAAAGVIYSGVVGDAPEGGKQQHEDTTVVN